MKTWDLETEYATAKDVEDSLLGVIVAESNARDTTNHALQTMSQMQNSYGAVLLQS